MPVPSALRGIPRYRLPTRNSCSPATTRRNLNPTALSSGSLSREGRLSARMMVHAHRNAEVSHRHQRSTEEQLPYLFDGVEYTSLEGLMDRYRAEVKRICEETPGVPGKDLFEDLMFIKALEAVGFSAMLTSSGVNPLVFVPLGIAEAVTWIGFIHHVMHGCTDKQENLNPLVQKEFVRKWGSWYLRSPFVKTLDGWEKEHSIHHRDTNGYTDPDLVERNFRSISSLDLPKPVKDLLLFGVLCMWQDYYYVPTNIKKHLDENHPEFKEHPQIRFRDFNLNNESGRELSLRVLKGIVEFNAQHILLPVAIAYYLSQSPKGDKLPSHFCESVGINLVLSRLMANLWSAVNVVPNHTGSGIKKVEGDQGELKILLSAMLGTADTDFSFDKYLPPQVNKFIADLKERLPFLKQLHLRFTGNLSEQIEHHACPKFTRSQLDRLRVVIEELAEEYGIELVRDPLIKRIKEMFEATDGKELEKVSFKKLSPTEVERLKAQGKIHKV